MILEDNSSGVRLRPYGADDDARLFEAARESIEAMYPWLEWCHPDYQLSEATEWTASQEATWNLGQGYQFMVERLSDGAFLGGVGLNQIDTRHRRANLGYWVRTSAAGAGVTTAAARLIANFGLETLALGRIEIIAAVENLASQRVAEKAGALREGVLRNRLLVHGRYHDAVSYSIITKPR